METPMHVLGVFDFFFLLLLDFCVSRVIFKCNGKLRVTSLFNLIFFFNLLLLSRVPKLIRIGFPDGNYGRDATESEGKKKKKLFMFNTLRAL